MSEFPNESPSASTPPEIITDRTARDMGYRMPGEFEPIEAIWLTYPHNEETWPGCLDRAQREYDFFMSQVARFATVHLIGPALDWPTTDAWIRDYGPIFVVNDTPHCPAPVALHDFQFNGWGGKYGGVDQYPGDNDVPRRVAEMLHVPRFTHAHVLEGGSIDVNGCGSAMVTDTCLLADTRNAQLSQTAIHSLLADALNVSHLIWLSGGVAGDDTDGHIDNLARFCSSTTIAAIRPDESHPNHAVLEANWQTLLTARDQHDQPFHLIPLPAPDPFTWDYPHDDWGPGGTLICPASYANFLIINEAVLVPVFDQPADEHACRQLEHAFPHRMIIPIPARHLVVGLGALHCLSQQQPKSPQT